MIAEVLIAATRFLVGGHARWQGSEPEAGQRIYFANHASHLDTLIALGGAARLAAPDHASGRGARLLGQGRAPALYRDHAAQRRADRPRAAARDPLAPLRGVLDRGRFADPVSRRHPRQERAARAVQVGPVSTSRGTFRQAELVPVYLDNLARAYPKGAILPAPISCAVSFGAALARIAGEAKPAFLARARDAVCALRRGGGGSEPTT